MKLITYAEAADILGVSVQTLKQCLEPNRNAMTRAGRRGTNGLLIEEQVRLFDGNNPRTGKRKRLSLDALTSEERACWHRYANEFNASQSVGVQITPDVEHLISEKVKEELTRQALARIREERRRAENDAQLKAEQEERFIKDNPFLEREALTA